MIVLISAAIKQEGNRKKSIVSILKSSLIFNYLNIGFFDYLKTIRNIVPALMVLAT